MYTRIWPFTLRLAAAHAILIFAAGYATALCAQPQPGLPGNYPNKPIHVLLGTGAGGGGDTVARAMSPQLTAHWGRQVVVDNRVGGGGVIVLEMLAQANPDGYTLYVGGSQIVTATVLKKVPFDVRKVYIPIAQLTSQPYVVLVNPSLPVNSIKDLIAYAKAKPGVLNYGSTGVGASSHLGVEIFDYMAGIKMAHIPYKATPQAIVDLISGEVQVFFISTISGMPHVKTGKLRALAVTSEERMRGYPELPTVAEAGLPGYELNEGYGLFGPAGMPQVLVLALNREMSAIMNSPEVAQQLVASGAEPAPANSPARFRQTVEARIDKLEKFFKASGLDPGNLR